ncbi:hypothetical protein SCUCBS95973_006067 [Sporothrix curviconia]|uniref:DUF7896 domain-containing protein n=1 Tax=Sporothrix curviconia TaxID=1260050 RepID=A0ABP0C2Y4_9PEZI
MVPSTSTPYAEVNEIGLDEFAVEPGQFLRARGIPDDSNMTSAAAIDYVAPSTCGSLTEATTFDAAMSVRLSDSFNDSSSLAANMVHADSQRSFRARSGALAAAAYTYDTSFDVSQSGTYFASDEAVHGAGSKYLAVGTTGHSPKSPSIQAYLYSGAQPMMRTSSVNTYSSLGGSTPSFDASGFAFPDSAASYLDAAVDMERSMSTSSARSNTSLQIRAKNCLRQQNSNAHKTQLLPKVDPVANADAAVGLPRAFGSSGGKIPASMSAAGGNGDGKMKIPLAKRERPKSKKLFCVSCNDRPEGFRGEHELQRHRSSRHSDEMKRWVCRDPGSESSIDAVRPLVDCKHCRDGKTYNAYYNAAAHLRRTHFKRKPGRKVPGSANGSAGKSNTPDGDSAKDWPEMSELKKWMYSITVSRGQAGSTADVMDELIDVEEEDEDERDDEGHNEDDEDEDEDEDEGEDEGVMVTEMHGESAVSVAAAAAAANTSLGSSDDHSDVFFGMGQIFGDTSMHSGLSMTRGGAVDRGLAAQSPEYQAEMPRLNGFQQPMYAQDGLISSAHFLEPQMNAGSLPLDFTGLVPSGLVSSPSGTTVTQGTAHPFHVDSQLEAYTQSFSPVDNLDFEFLSPCL